MKKVLKWTGIIILAFIIISAIYGTFGLKKALSLQIEHVELNRIPDGTYTGTYESYRWTNTVAVTIKDHKLITIAPVSPLAGREDLTVSLTQSILDSQTNAVDTVSGATASSNAFLKAVETALKKALN